jgi:Lon protease-like protein
MAVEIPIFPLPNVVLFPGVILPLHIFEERYLNMVSDVLSHDQIIGMVLLRNGYQDHFGDNPPVYDIGCSGLVTHSECLPDGRYNIVLRGLEKFKIHSEDQSHGYRIARVERIVEEEATISRNRLPTERRHLEQLLERQLTMAGKESKVPRAMTDENLVNTLAQYLDFDAVEKQALLQREGLVARCRSLIELMEMKMLIADRDFSRIEAQ